MAAASRDLQGLLAGLDPTADVAQRHIWLIDIFDWLRGDRASPQAAIGRVQLLLDAIEARPELRERLRAWWRAFTQTVDLTTLLADYGFAPRTAFASELSERLRRKILPGTPETTDASDLFRMVLPGVFDAGWIALLDETQLGRIGALLADAALDEDGAPRWRHTVMDAVTYCSSQVVAAGFSPELRLRMSTDAVGETRPFHALMADLDELREQMFDRPGEPRDEEALQAAFVAFRDRLDACRAGAASVYTHLEDNGISVGLVFRLRQLRERVLRIRELLDCLMAPNPGPSVARLVGRLVLAGGERNSIRALIASNSSMLAAKVTERSAETGEHYITRDRASYLRMVKKAAGGGAFTAVTVLLKFGIYALGLSAFWSGLGSGLMYAASFVAIQLLHLTLATKQPAMTAPAMAARLRDIKSDAAVDDFVDEVANLVRSQVAAVLGNVLVVVPTVAAIALLAQFALERPLLDAAHAAATLKSLSLAGPTALYAAITGILLFSASIIAGWTENAFVLHRMDSAMRYNPRIGAFLGAARARRWADFMRTNISGFASNISLGLMLGLLPAFAGFFGLGLDVRHVTLSAGQIAAAAASTGLAVLQQPALWWAVAAIPVIGALNVSVSFYFAFRLALRAHSVSLGDRARIRSAIWARWRSRPVSFFLPG
ncbi:site-specific recombinase [Variovorax sp. NFACC27]|uniref:site-specific recombinase n=1 Tax=unclassified Variovorax TaxID=663243 RepID=UPI00089C7B9F|nr:site-specific recombinase [Variovorax paradoxus]SEF26137.1 Site-specific recombinase [Variovorax sp. NFACC28]SEG52837.1 Site-specific recombinase [Variovorax sp. NFACC29]SFC16927.1 Site-specific recombinase [Variovorax sp. NFACC26]SFG99982.1 Site-specific recombinase [Variovorax sp. NFACC27]